ncbi:hypothetical protein ERO13_D03G069100v2 [Gossypium hirsutum]|nr:tobamovirus multiplication protein 3-like isoform X2 [Gossypium hirsutum]XP_016739628.1 tobamovirus multiplication protein 3-like isoform X2 [Gossypium hirsutum]XP_016739629.1 tobamovirus multiplication protein 3-like isoform X2 [Gossypium hirsutum]XP_040945768.1 tobamovirus multiplication protein 3-like isoform X2 [Gossypium hirsutum]KAB2037401.1 hypothetical protein ES319_D03G072900v1 [Gossypium barbadense]TYG76013.1 hypothetical protein ES288_D03G079500v1 [Gossypium darwinii]TYH79647.1 
MLQRFPVESKGRRKKLQEVGYVTTICFTCFLVRCIMMCFNAFDKGADLDVLNHPILNLIYYLLVEILPSSLVLFILRKLLPKRGVSLFAALGFLLYGGRDDEDDSVAKMKAAEEALEAKQKVTNSLPATCSFFFIMFYNFVTNCSWYSEDIYTNYPMILLYLYCMAAPCIS